MSLDMEKQEVEDKNKKMSSFMQHQSSDDNFEVEHKKITYIDEDEKERMVARKIGSINYIKKTRRN